MRSPYASASMTGTTFVNNTAGQTGGGGYFGSSASMTGTTFMSNTAGLYGGGGAFLGSASMTGTTFMSNTANSNGGGGYFFASANVTGTTFMSNTSSDNGGGGFFNGIAHVTGTTFMSNTALVAGGGYFKVSANMTGTTFMSNTASFGGGSFFGDAANVVDTTFIGNIASSATHGGGGVYFNFPGARTFINVLFAHNRATKHGAALYVQLANPLNLIHVTIVSQTMPTGATEAIYVFDGTVNLTNTLIATHTVGIERVGGTASENYTLFSGVSTPYSGTITAGANSITGTAAFFDTTNYTLTDSSRAIDAGTNAGVMGDYFGNARPQGNGFDIGYAESPFMANSDLGITKTTAASSVSSGATLTYTIIISNNGMLLAPNVVMTDAMPAGVTFGSGSVITPGGSGTCAATGCNLGDLAAGAYATATFTVTAPSIAGVITNTAGVSASNDSPTSNNFAAVTTTVIVASCPAVLTVDDLGDADDATPGDKTCSTSGGNCTLRAAIMEANASLTCTPLTIDFSVNGTVNLNAALPNLDHPNLTIDGPGASLLTVRRAAAAASEFRIFTINESKTITIQKVTVSHGYFASGNNLGGGIQSNKGRLTLRQCVLSNNQAYSGGGLYLNGNSSSWTVIDECTIRDNVIYTSTNIVLDGGGIYVWNGTLTMTNSTVSGNMRTGGTPTTIQGTGLELQDNASVSLNNCTFSGNVGRQAVNNFASTLTMTNCSVISNTLNSTGLTFGAINTTVGNTWVMNTLVANNTGSNGTNFKSDPGTLTSLGNNLDSDGTSSFTNGVNGDIVGTSRSDQINVYVGPLADNGGSTQTHLLLADSPAINAGKNSGAPSTDQRGMARPKGSQVDIGAVEVYEANIGIIKTVNANTVNRATTLTYTLYISNSGSYTATGAVLTESLPAGAVFSSAQVITDGGTIVCSATGCALGDLAPGAYVTTTFVITSPNTPGVITNTAGVSAGYDIATPNNFALVTATVLVPGCFATHDDGSTVFSSEDAQAVRDALAAVSSGGTVKVAGYCAGVQTQQGSTQVALITKTLTVAGGYTTSNWSTYNPTANPTTLDALNGGRVISTTNVDVTLMGFKATNGTISTTNNENGGGIYAANALSLLDMTIDHNIITGTSGIQYGGGVYVGGAATISNTTLSNNTARTDGGGVFVLGTSVVTSSTFSLNQASSGNGGGARLVGDAIVTDVRFVTNTATTGGGVVFDSMSTISNALFSNNSAASTGAAGGAYFNGISSLTNVTFTQNSAGNQGGGGAVFVGNTALSGGAFMSNTAAFAGGGAYFGGAVILTDTTFTNNTATSNRGGGAYFNGTANLLNANFTQNQASADRGGGAYFRLAATLSGTNFLTNTASNRAGGAYFFDAATMTNTNFIGNVGTSRGGGVYISAAANMVGGFIQANQCTATCLGGGLFTAGTLSLTGTQFLSNTTDAQGGGAYLSGASVITNAIFATNGGGNGAGAYFTSTVASQVVNSLFARNSASSNGSAIYVANAAPLSLIHATLADGTGSQAIYVASGAMHITNTLISTHTAGIQVASGSASEDYGLFSAVTTPYIGTVNTGGHSITGTAAFFDTTYYTLTVSSHAIDIGTNAGVNVDYFGNSRPQGNGFDAGYYESPFTAYADLGIAKTATPNIAAVGGMLTYTLSISNQGHVIAPNVVLTEALPAGVGFVAGSVITPGGSGSCSATGCNLGELIAGGYATATFTVTAPNSAGVITNTAGITASNDNITSNNFAALTTTVLSVDVSIAKTASAASVTVGGRLTYTLVISNNGGATATSVVLTDAMPAGITFISGNIITPSGTGTCAATGCNLGDLAAGGYITVTYAVTVPNTAGVITNTAGVSASNDSLTSNNFASVTATVTNLAPIASAGIDQNVNVGASVTLNGSASSDPDEHTPLSYLWTQTGGTAVTLSSVSVASPNFTAPASPTVLTFTLLVTDATGLGASTVDTIVVTVNEIAIAGLAAQSSSPTVLGGTTYLTASISAGSNVTYEWNFGDGNTGSGATVTHLYTPTGVYTAVVTATNAAGQASVTTIVTIIALPLPPTSPPSNEPPPYTPPEPLPPNEDEANIGMQDGGSPPEAAPGEVIALVYRVSLAGERNGTSVLFVATLPAGLDFDSVTLQPPGGKCDFIAESGRVECQLGIVTQDRPVTVTLRVRAPQVGRFVVPAQAIGLDTRIVDMPGNNAVQNIIVVSPAGAGQGDSGVRLGSGFGSFVTCSAEGGCVLRWATEGAQNIVRYELVREPVGAPTASLRGGPSIRNIAPKEVDGRASYEVIDSDVLAGRTYDYTVRGVGADGAIHLLQTA